MARDSKEDGDGGAEAHSKELMLKSVQTGLMEVKERLANGRSVKRYIVLPVSTRIKFAKTCAPYYAPKIKQAAQTKNAADCVTAELPGNKDVGGAAKAHTGKLPHELMLEWAQTGLMEVPQQVANGRFVRNYVVLSVAKRVSLAKACAPYYAAKIVFQEQPSTNEQAAETKHADSMVEELPRKMVTVMELLKRPSASRPHELMLEWVQTKVMVVPEPVKNGYFVKKLSGFSVSSYLKLLFACMPYYHAKIDDRRRAGRRMQAGRRDYWSKYCGKPAAMN